MSFSNRKTLLAQLETTKYSSQRTFVEGFTPRTRRPFKATSRCNWGKRNHNQQVLDSSSLESNFWESSENDHRESRAPEAAPNPKSSPKAKLRPQNFQSWSLDIILKPTIKCLLCATKIKFQILCPSVSEPLWWRRYLFPGFVGTNKAKDPDQGSFIDMESSH